ncbi:MAG: methionine gamma-lyase family protein [Clostridia bacterium]|nr:methionine gamma-lyase family protein [Clostridia bacterium]
MIDVSLINKCEKKLNKIFSYFEDIALFNQEKVLNTFKKNQIALRHFSGTTGYGYGDEGRDTLNKVIADIFKCESAICSPTIVSGTHALALCLYGVLRPNDKFLSITGTPYDTLNDVIKGKGTGSLEDYNVTFDSIELDNNGNFNKDKIKDYLLNNSPKMVYLQRSRGYAWRSALSIEKIEEIVKFVKDLGFNGCIMLDNCYGEFMDKREATEVGVNLLAGSMIKNIGGGIAPTGGYVCGDEKYVELVKNRLTAPSISGEVGSYYSGYQYFYQGLFLAPHTVLQSVKGTLLFGEVLRELGYKTSPETNEEIPNDIILSIMFKDKEKLIKFIQCIQKNSPIDSHVLALPWAMPGYNDEVIMAAGCFVQGSSIELSADAPIKPPYIAYLQGGLTYEHCKIALKNLEL